MSGPDFIEPDWPAGDRIRAITTTRKGGFSTGPWASMNLASHVGDDPGSVASNRSALLSELELAEDPAWLSQLHGTRIIDPADDGADRHADGAVTRKPGAVCVVLTADCLPLFLTDVDEECVAVLHVGWRGLAGGIIESGLEKMGVPPGRVLAWSGPAIGPDHFEIGGDVRAELGGAPVHYRDSGRKGHFLADLYGLVDERLRSAGVAHHGWHPCCTVTDEESFFSYRRDGVTGRMASLIWRMP